MKEHIRKILNEVANGQIPSGQLSDIDTLPGEESEDHKLNATAAAAYNQMVDAAKKDGITWGLVSSYRPLETQKRLAKTLGLYKRGGKAAVPGTSNHGWGSAVDIDFKKGSGKRATFRWLKDNASKFGFSTIGREPWHWEHKASAKNIKSDGVMPDTGGDTGGDTPSQDIKKPSGIVATPEMITTLVSMLKSKNIKSSDIKPFLDKTVSGSSKTIGGKEVGGKNVNVTEDKDYVIINPDYKGSNVHVLFGGSHTSSYSRNGANVGAMKKYVNYLQPYTSNAMIVITHHMNTLDNVERYVKEKFGKTVKSIAGFSQGGKETWRHAGDSSLKLVGLIDPSTYKTDVSFGSNTYLVCNPKNWGTSGFYGQTRKKLEWYCDNQAKYQGHVECVPNKGHMDFGILKYFYSEYGNRI
jgi:hypothetical protein